MIDTCKGGKAKLIDLVDARHGGECPRNKYHDIEQLLYSFGMMFMDVGTRIWWALPKFKMKDYSMCTACRTHQAVRETAEVLLRYASSTDVMEQLEATQSLLTLAEQMLASPLVDVEEMLPSQGLPCCSEIQGAIKRRAAMLEGTCDQSDTCSS